MYSSSSSSIIKDNQPCRAGDGWKSCDDLEEISNGSGAVTEAEGRFDDQNPRAHRAWGATMVVRMCAERRDEKARQHAAARGG